ncbi:MAG TPA: small, acid-soluble spore protein, alpha/beta type [Bacillota bacterium]
MSRNMPRRFQRRLTSRPDPLYPLKVKIAMDLGLLEKARRVGWGNLSSAETGRVGGWMTRIYGRTPPRSLRLLPGRERRRREAR